MKITGFTLIELLIVIAIIGGLTSIVVVTFPASQGRARDANRRQEIKQYQIAIEGYANKQNGIYPKYNSLTKVSTLCGATKELSKYSGSCADDPRDGNTDCEGLLCQYNYYSNALGTQYALWARLERPANTTDLCFVVCSNGLSGDGPCPTTDACSI
jgi:prepilin-type N-terminal cleavage/methylation domain-containing protein